MSAADPELDVPVAISIEVITSKDKWLPDSSTDKCKKCGIKFSFSVRRHHCRVCGDIFCGTCATECGVFHDEVIRVCTVCFAKREAELAEEENKRKQKQERLRQARIQDVQEAKAASEEKKGPESPKTPDKDKKLDAISTHKLRQQQYQIRAGKEEEEKLEREKKEKAENPWLAPAPWAESSSRIRRADLNYTLSDAPAVVITLIEEDKWMPDGDSAKCLDCGQRFDSIYRRHHCRACGGLFCQDCSPEIGVLRAEAQRICGDCYCHFKKQNAEKRQEEQARRVKVKTALEQRRGVKDEGAIPVEDAPDDDGL